MPTLSKINHNELNYLLGKNYEWVYARLEKILTTEELGYFAKTNSNDNERIWITEEHNTTKAYDRLSEDEKDIVSGLIEDFEATIRPKLRADDELTAITEEILTVTSENQIFWVKNKNTGETSVVLTQWGCTTNSRVSDINPLDKIRRRPKKHHTKVEVIVRYSDKGLAANANFFFFYKNVIQAFTTNADGQKKLGLIKNGADFSIGTTNDGSGDEVSLLVVEGQTQYEVILPYYTSAQVNVINQEGESVPACEIKASYSHSQEVFTTDENGNFQIDRILLDENPLVLSKNDAPSITKSYSLSKTDNSFVFEIKERKAKDIILKVMDDTGKIMPNYPIIVKVNEKIHNATSNADGIIEIKDVEIDESIQVIDGKNEAHFEDFQITAAINELVFEIKPPVIEILSILLIDHKKKPLPNIPMNVTIAGEQHDQTTNEKGKLSFPKSLFTDGEKVKTQIHLNTEKESKKKEKIVKKSFTYTNETPDYVIQLKKRNWLWLLLLLLPLLLIRCEKDVTIKTVYGASSASVPNASIHFEYNKAFIYDEGAFFTNEAYQENGSSDSLGVITYQKLEYSVYSYIFKHFSTATIFSTDGCYASDTIQPIFHRISAKDTLILKLHPIQIDANIIVVDSEDGQPLNKAAVIIKTEINGHIFIDSTETNANGMAYFANLPKCGKVIEISGDLTGYHPDSISNTTVEHLLTDEENRKLKLRPIKETIEFFVVSCRTGEPLPNAIATILITNAGKKLKQKVYTNVSGKGKGIYSKIHVLAEIEIDVKKRYFKNGRLKKSYKVGDFIEFPDSLRTICLEPEENPINFTNIDSLTKKPLVGVTNIISINRAGVISKDTVISNRNGVFTVAGVIFGDEISITSIFKPNYLTNSHMIRKKDVIKLMEGPARNRVIPLKPKELTLLFRTVDPTTNSLVDDATLIVYIDGRRVVMPNNSGNGEFEVMASYSSIISITAKKIGYTQNDTKIRNKAMRFLSTSLQDKRDIPLKKDQKPRKSCRIFVSGKLISDRDEGFPGFSTIYVEDAFSEYVGQGEYPDNTKAFPKSVASTFDGIAIDEGTRVIIYSKKNFGGTILLDKTGPAIINNNQWPTETTVILWKNKTFLNPNLQNTFPPSTRSFSKVNMHPWSYGSMKVICK